MVEVQKTLSRLINERDNHFRSAADHRLQAETLDCVISKLDLAIRNDIEAARPAAED